MNDSFVIKPTVCTYICGLNRVQLYLSMFLESGYSRTSSVIIILVHKSTESTDYICRESNLTSNLHYAEE